MRLTKALTPIITFLKYSIVTLHLNAVIRTPCHQACVYGQRGTMIKHTDLSEAYVTFHCTGEYRPGIKMLECFGWGWMSLWGDRGRMVG